jgi:hypothetical protein
MHRDAKSYQVPRSGDPQVGRLRYLPEKPRLALISLALLLPHVQQETANARVQGRQIKTLISLRILKYCHSQKVSRFQQDIYKKISLHPHHCLRSLRAHNIPVLSPR